MTPSPLEGLKKGTKLLSCPAVRLRAGNFSATKRFKFAVTTQRVPSTEFESRASGASSSWSLGIWPRRLGTPPSLQTKRRGLQDGMVEAQRRVIPTGKGDFEKSLQDL
eukprot:CAMPEP_0172653676 /NCGR_PEP_ID=MMETSP1068-20121228/243949_1 /TAXON_ID=35684 /ORGANISM="Pseudopedinella elastica, Strain CCMP716" /LENGTH=107 /DNA_ID=CAMNT_0013468111 /DNA_START=444 /DNA_END=764 /DNA_ORIENTATION=-